MQAYVEGVSIRRVDDLVIAVGGTGISKSEVFRICAPLDGDVAAWRTRPLDEHEFPYVFLDATYCKARIDHRVVSQAVVIATGVSADGPPLRGGAPSREVLGSDVGDSETWGYPRLRGRRSGRSSCAACGTGDWAGSSWSSATATAASPTPSTP